MRVSFIGSGNVATHLAKASKEAGIHIINIYSKNLQNAESLAALCNAKAVENSFDLDTNIDLLIVSVSDDALPSISEQVKNFPCPVVHTAGSVNINAVYGDEHAYGVLYPLQTFSKTREQKLQNTPFFVEASESSLEITLKQFVAQIGGQYNVANSEQRLHLHIAAVFACNFSNYMYSLAHNLLSKHQLSFEHLVPLILETAKKIQHLNPQAAQTGPAKRHDHLTMQKHLEALQEEPFYHSLYMLISAEIEKNQNS
jgi:predicted short-subunit dehydrogenase-like oxidoreductase (DUF2520 family)